MSEMVERVGRAIYPHIRQAYVDCCQEEGVPMELTPGIGFADEAFVAARAAIAAMREPTEAMLLAMRHANKLKDAWPLMIDAALAENGQ